MRPRVAAEYRAAGAAGWFGEVILEQKFQAHYESMRRKCKQNIIVQIAARFVN